MPRTKGQVGWSPDELQLVLNSPLTARELAVQLGKTERAVKAKRWALRNPEQAKKRSDASNALKYKRWRAQKHDPDVTVRGAWTDEETARLLDGDLATATITQAAKALGRTLYSVRSKLYQQQSPESYLERRIRCRKKHQYKWNKTYKDKHRPTDRERVVCDPEVLADQENFWRRRRRRRRSQEDKLGESRRQRKKEFEQRRAVGLAQVRLLLQEMLKCPKSP